MRNIATSLGFAALVLASTACKKDMTKDVEQFADRACACKDATCAEHVVDDLVAYAKEHKGAQGDQARANTAARRLGKCVIEAGMSLEKLQTQMQLLQKLDD